MAMKGRDILIFLAVKYNGAWNKIYEAIKNKELVDEQQVFEAVESTKKFNTITIIDDDYPEALKKIYKPPFVIFTNKKRTTPLDRNSYTLGVMEGSKKPTHVETAELSTILNQILDVNSTQLIGLSNDEIFEMGTKIKRSNNTTHIRVLTSGIEHALPAEDNVLTISEYFTGPHVDEHIGWASRLVVGLSNGLYTPNITKTSKNSSAIGYAMYMGINVMINRATTKLAMDIFKSGGIMVDSYKDIEDAMYHNGRPTPDKTALKGSPIV